MANNELELKISEVSGSQIQALLYFSLMREYVENITDYQIWNFDDADTERFMEKAEQIFEVGAYDGLCDISVEKILEYAKSVQQQL